MVLIKITYINFDGRGVLLRQYSETSAKRISSERGDLVFLRDPKTHIVNIHERIFCVSSSLDRALPERAVTLEG